MAEAGPSASASTPVDILGTPIGKRPRSEAFFLVVRIQPPSYVFPNERFELEFSVEGSSASTSPPTDFEVSASLVNINPAQAKNQCFLEVIDSPRISASRKTGTIRCFIRSPKVSRTHGCSLQIHLRASERRIIAPCTTRTVSLVNAKLRVTMSADWSNTWFKDEGGRDKCMEGEVSLWNDRSEKIREPLPLDLVLCYSGEQNAIVSNQDLLRRIGTEQKFQIEGDSGSGKIRFRVEDVSKNHQGQNFVVKISAGSANIRDVGPTSTPPVSVRSKRNRQKQRPSIARPPSAEDQPFAELPIPTSTAEGGRRSTSSEVRAFEGADPVRLRSAVQAIVRWADEVVNSLYYMQWQVIGYEHRPDGTMDYSRPLHNIQNPNPTIDRVLSIYNESIRDDLGYLQGAVEQRDTRPTAAATSVRGSPYSVAAPTPIQSLPGTVQTPTYSRPIPPAQPFARSSSSAAHAADFHQYPTQQQPRPYPPYYYMQGMHEPHLPHAAKLSPREPSPVVEDRKISSAIDRESEVEYVLAKQYKSVRTGERLGFPAYSDNHELLGFYRESSTKVGASHFDPIRPHEFGPSEKHEAKRILVEAIEHKSNAVHALKDWGSMARLIDHCLVYNFSKDIGDSPAVSESNR